MNHGLDLMQELVVFVHGMANFSHNRVVGSSNEKEAQERLIRERLGQRHQFLGAFDDSGNYGFRTIHSPAELKAEILEALGSEYRVKGAVVAERASIAETLDSLDILCGKIYRGQFQDKDNLVLKDLNPWRLGLVFVQEMHDARIGYVPELLELECEHVEVLTVQEGIVGVLKFDPKKPRIPWGRPAKVVEDARSGLGATWLATARSAGTVRGVLRRFIAISGMS